MKKIFLWLFSGCSLLLFSGCTGDIIEFGCFFVPDPDHCYQTAAVQNANPEDCEKIQGSDFVGQNPPRDKCYLQIAENTGDYSACDNIKGGINSYSKEECILGAAIRHNDPAGCALLTGNDFEKCKTEVGLAITTDQFKTLAEEIEKAKSAFGADPDNEELKNELNKLLEKQKNLYAIAPAEIQNQYFKEQREKIMEDIEDEDVQSAIVHQMTSVRQENPNMNIDDLIKKMTEIKEQQEYVKHLDEEASKVFDEMKQNITDFATTELDNATGASELAEEMQNKGIEWFKENGGERMKYGIESLEAAKEKYDKASEQFEQISEQIEKLKKVYDEAAEVYGKIDDVNKLVAEGKLTKDKAGVLHGAILLNKGLEYATGYVPVFGSTISTISKETFDATIKFATSRAQRTTALDKCIDDPENCDPSGISPY